MEPDTKIAQALAKPGMEYGPYLLFLRARMGLSEYHDFDDWEFLAGARDQQMWGQNGLITIFSKPSELNPLGGLSDVPSWVDFLELASVSLEWASFREKDRATWLDARGGIFFEEDDYDPSVANMMITCDPGATPDKRTFDNRLLVVMFGEEGSVNGRTTETIKRRLGQGAVGVWHSRDMEAIAFRDSRSPATLMGTLSDFAHQTDPIYDLGIFKLAATAPLSGPLSPLQAFLVR